MFDLILVLTLLLLGFAFGHYLEAVHYKSIMAREDKTLNQVCLTDKKAYRDLNIASAKLTTGSAVIAIDYFKKILFGLRNVFGGEGKSYSSLIDRARREAILRMKEAEPTADLFLNVRLETFSISKGVQGNIAAVEMFAYGTAVWLSNEDNTEKA